MLDTVGDYNNHIHRLGEVTFTCEECGQSEIRPAKYGRHGQLLGHRPRFCHACLKVHDQDHRRGKLNQRPRDNLWSPERKETAAHLWHNGHSAAEIARHLGSVTRNAVIGLLYRMGLLGNRPKAHKSLEAKHHRRTNNRPRKTPPVSRGQKARKSPASASLPLAVTSALPPLNLSIIDVKDGQCKFIAGNDGLCCAHPVHAESSWCPSHYALCHNLVTDQRSPHPRGIINLFSKTEKKMYGPSDASEFTP